MPSMAKKTGMSDSSLWIATIVLLTLAVWMYFKRLAMRPINMGVESSRRMEVRT
jgi:hypothetical protein